MDAAADKSALHSVSVQQLIEMLDLSGAVVTADALHCQRETAEKIVAKQADFVLMGKGNQETLQTDSRNP